MRACMRACACVRVRVCVCVCVCVCFTLEGKERVCMGRVYMYMNVFATAL